MEWPKGETMASKSERLKKIETQLKPCRACEHAEEQATRFEEALASLGVKPLEAVGSHAVLKRCKKCGYQLNVFVGFDGSELRAKGEALDEFMATWKPGQVVTRETWQQFFDYNEKLMQQFRAYYGADVYDQAIQATDDGELWAAARRLMEAAPTEAELKATRISKVRTSSD